VATTPDASATVIALMGELARDPLTAAKVCVCLCVRVCVRVRVCMCAGGLGH
jgi:hypothetical protein